MAETGTDKFDFSDVVEKPHQDFDFSDIVEKKNGGNDSSVPAKQPTSLLEAFGQKNTDATEPTQAEKLVTAVNTPDAPYTQEQIDKGNQALSQNPIQSNPVSQAETQNPALVEGENQAQNLKQAKQIANDEYEKVKANPKTQPLTNAVVKGQTTLDAIDQDPQVKQIKDLYHKVDAAVQSGDMTGATLLKSHIDALESQPLPPKTPLEKQNALVPNSDEPITDSESTLLAHTADLPENATYGDLIKKYVNESQNYSKSLNELQGITAKASQAKKTAQQVADFTPDEDGYKNKDGFLNGIGIGAKQTINGVAKGLLHVMGNEDKAVQLSNENALDNYLYPEKSEGIGSDVGKAVGSVAPYIIPSLLFPEATPEMLAGEDGGMWGVAYESLPSVAKIMQAALGSSLMGLSAKGETFDQEYQRAKASGANEDQARQIARQKSNVAAGAQGAVVAVLPYNSNILKAGEMSTIKKAAADAGLTLGEFGLSGATEDYLNDNDMLKGQADRLKQGLALMIGMGLAHSGLNAGGEVLKNVIGNSIARRLPDVEAGVNQMIQSGQITPEEGAAFLKPYQDRAEVLDKMPDDLPTSKDLKIYPLLQEKMGLLERKKSEDNVAFERQGGTKDKIAAIDKEMADIYAGRGNDETKADRNDRIANDIKTNGSPQEGDIIHYAENQDAIDNVLSQINQEQNEVEKPSTVGQDEENTRVLGSSESPPSEEAKPELQEPANTSEQVSPQNGVEAAPVENDIVNTEANGSPDTSATDKGETGTGKEAGGGEGENKTDDTKVKLKDGTKANIIVDKSNPDKISLTLLKDHSDDNPEIDNDRIGSVDFKKNKDGTYTGSIPAVWEEYQRKGAMTALYNHFEKMGYTIKPSDTQTPQGKAFWKSRGKATDKTTDTKIEPPKVTSERQKAINDGLDLQERHNDLIGKTSNKNISERAKLEQQIKDHAEKHGFNIHKAQKLIQLQSESGKPLKRSDPSNTNQGESANHTPLSNRSKESQELFTKFDKLGTNWLPEIYGEDGKRMSIKQKEQAIKDVKSGIPTNGAESLLNTIDGINKSGKIHAFDQRLGGKDISIEDFNKMHDEAEKAHRELFSEHINDSDKAADDYFDSLTDEQLKQLEDERTRADIEGVEGDATREESANGDESRNDNADSQTGKTSEGSGESSTPKSEDNPAPEEKEVKDDKFMGINHEALIRRSQELGEEAPQRADTMSPEEIIERGRTLLKDGADPEKYAEDFNREKLSNTDRLSVVRAHLEDVTRNTEMIGREKGEDSNEYKDAVREEDKWRDLVKRMGSEQGLGFRALQGETSIDSGTFRGLQRDFEDTHGRPMSPTEQKTAKELAEKNKVLEAKNRELQAQLDKLHNEGINQDSKGKYTKGAKEIADRIRKLKSKPFTFTDSDGNVFEMKENSIIPINDIIEGVAKAVEKGGVLADAVKVALDKYKNEDWYINIKDKKGFSDAISNQLSPAIDLKTRFVDKGKSDLNFSKEDARDIWNYAKENYLDKGRENVNMLKGVSADLGLTVDQIRSAIATPKGAREVTDEMYKVQSARRNALSEARSWVKNANASRLEKGITAIPRMMFSETVFGHTGVLFETHAGMQKFDPSIRKEYWKNWPKQYKFAYGSVSKFEKAIEDLQMRPNYTLAKKAGLANDIAQKGIDVGYMTRYLDKIGLGKISDAGNRGYSALKVLRQDLFDHYYNSIPQSQKTLDMANQIAKNVNNMTGANGFFDQVQGKPKSIIDTTLFAPKLMAAKFSQLSQPLRAAYTTLNWYRATPTQKYQAKFVGKKSAIIAATYLASLAANQGIQSVMGYGKSNPVNFTDPKKPDWLNFKAGNKTTIIGAGGMTSVLRFVTNLAMGAINPAKGKQVDEEIAKAVKTELRSILSPFSQSIADVVTRKDMKGNTMPWTNQKPQEGRHKMDLIEYMMSDHMPIPVSDAFTTMYQTMRDEGTSKVDIHNFFNGVISGALAGFTGIQKREYDNNGQKPLTAAMRAYLDVLNSGGTKESATNAANNAIGRGIVRNAKSSVSRQILSLKDAERRNPELKNALDPQITKLQDSKKLIKRPTKRNF